MEGEWNYDLRTFMTLEKKDEQDKFEEMEDMVNATKEVFISETHQKAMATEGEDIESVDTIDKEWSASVTSERRRR